MNLFVAKSNHPANFEFDLFLGPSFEMYTTLFARLSIDISHGEESWVVCHSNTLYKTTIMGIQHRALMGRSSVARRSKQ